MQADEVKADKQGETREALLKEADMLPSGVRNCRRAYVVPPRPSTTSAKFHA